MKTVFRIFDRSIQALIFLCIAGFVLAAFAQVFFRFVLNDSLSWSEEFCRYLFVWMVFLGAGIGVLHRRHVTIDIVPNLMPKFAKKYHAVFVDILIIVFSILLIYHGYHFALRGMRQRSPAMQLPLGYVYSGIIVGGVVMLTNTVRVICSELFAIQTTVDPEPETEPDISREEFNRLLGIEIDPKGGRDANDA